MGCFGVRLGLFLPLMPIDSTLFLLCCCCYIFIVLPFRHQHLTLFIYICLSSFFLFSACLWITMYKMNIPYPHLCRQKCLSPMIIMYELWVCFCNGMSCSFIVCLCIIGHSESLLTHIFCTFFVKQSPSSRCYAIVSRAVIK